MLTSHSPQRARTVIIALQVVTCLSLGCSDALPTRPSETVSVTSVSPSTGRRDIITELTIHGSGFVSGASVYVGGAATNVRVFSSSVIVVTTPLSDAGTVDVVVTNPNGQSARLVGGFRFIGLVLNAVLPKHGLPGDFLSLIGAGFNAGTRMTIGGIDTEVFLWNNAVLNAFVPPMLSGSVDITAANPDGERQTLTQAFTFDSVAISASPNIVPAGGPLTVTFRAPSGRPAFDWVGLFRSGDVNENYLWWQYTGGSAQGTITIPAPTPPGDYQFRYFADDNIFDAARSGVVTVTDARGAGLAAASVRAMPTPGVLLRRPGRGRGR